MTDENKNTGDRDELTTEAAHACRCEECGTGLRDDSIRRCAECGTGLCDDCVCPCAECGTAVCHECQSFCARCGEGMCPDCGYTCSWCDGVTCPECTLWCDCDNAWCCDDCRDRCRGCSDVRHPEYDNPYRGTPAERLDTFSVGLEIEIDGEHDRERMQEHELIAGWCTDGSLHHGGLEYQTQPITCDDRTIDMLTGLAAGIHRADEDSAAGGHMHVSRTSRQTPSRWYWALKALTPDQCDDLNMRHHTDCRWCRLEHGLYHGKATAVNDDHHRTIELRTFGAWHAGTAHKLDPAIRWAHAMWRLFQHHPVYSLKQADIMACSRTAHHAAMPAPARKGAR